MTKMNPEIKVRWVAALRSGEYRQGRGKLREGDGFCCLAVLCDLHAKETGAQWDENEYMTETHTPPDPVVTWAGMTQRNPNLTLEEGTYAAAEFNDGVDTSLAFVRRRTFAEIADAIESQL